MTDPHITDAFRELVVRGLIAAAPAPQLLACGNVDRADSSRQSWRVPLPSGEWAKLTLGRDLALLAARQAAFAQACPKITPAQLAHARLPGGEALIEAYFDGPTLEAAATSGKLPPDVIRRAVTDIRGALAATEQPSSESARSAEWTAWIGQLLALPVWQPAETSCLETTLLPALYQRLASVQSVTRWTNGDFLPSNILLHASGESRLIDAEFAGRTHFFCEDAVRFQALSPAGQEHPDLFAGLLPEPGLPWHLYFWLRQLQLESEHNTPAYLSRVRSDRLGLIRRLAETGLGLALGAWTTPALTVEHGVEDIRWMLDTDHLVRISGWCHVPAAGRLRRIVALGPDERLATAPPLDRPDVQQHFKGNPGALASGFILALDPRPAGFSITLCALIDQGTLVPFRQLTPEDEPRGALFWEDYADWAARHDPDPPPSAPAIGQPGKLFSILLPVYKTPEAYLRNCIDSVLAQHYPHWELCLVDDGSELPGISALLQSAATDPRIRVQTRAGNGGISVATNDALAMARGEFVVLLDHDDLLRPHALAEFALRLAREPDLDVLYSDEDKITADGRRLIPFLKPDFSPEFLLGVMYVGHALGVRTTVARATGGFDASFDGIQDYEFLLRVTERTRRIGHIPRLLYHWRQSPGSSALHGNIKGDMDQKQARAVQAHLQRRGDRRVARPTGGHRLVLDDPAIPTVEMVRAADAASAVAALRQGAATCTADVLILLTAETRPISASSLAALAALASQPDTGCAAPLLLSSEGRVYESGLSGSRSLMRGFHPGSDGYHGTLRCNREVDAVSPLCIAVRRVLVAGATESPGTDWLGFCAALRSSGRYHRVCATAQVQINASFHDPISPIAPALVAREFYHPLFDSLQGDYTLGSPTHDRPIPGAPLEFHVDQPASWDVPLRRCLISRGWCFSGPDSPITGIRLRIAGMAFAGVIGLPRPDVLAARPDAPDEFTGFEIRATLPAGRHQASLEARSTDGRWQLLVTQPVIVTRQFLPLWLGGGDWMELMFFQMSAHMIHPPRPLRPETFPPGRKTGARPKLTIVTPSYNHARFLPETMGSVLAQAGVTCEYVVQDGGSTDGSMELIRGQAGRLHSGASEPDAGQADAIARGFAKTTGAPEDLMAWINSDDFYLPGSLAFVSDYFARHPDVDVIYGHRILVNEESQEIGRWFIPRHDPGVLLLNDFVPQETLFWRRRIWDRVGGIDPAFKFALDWDLLLRFQAAGAKIVRVPRFLACFRIHASQKTSARMHDVGQEEITRLRERTHDRPFAAQELEQNPVLLGYLRRSAFIEWLWKLGLRAP